MMTSSIRLSSNRSEVRTNQNARQAGASCSLYNLQVLIYPKCYESKVFWWLVYDLQNLQESLCRVHLVLWLTASAACSARTCFRLLNIVSRIIKLWYSFSVRYRLTAVTSTQRPSLRPLILPVFRMNVVSSSYVNILSKTSRLLASCLCFVGCFFPYHCLSNSEFKRCYFFITCLPLCFVVLSRLCCIPNWFQLFALNFNCLPSQSTSCTAWDKSKCSQPMSVLKRLYACY